MSTTEDPSAGFLTLIKELDNAPLPEQVEKWKQEHGDIFALALSDKEVFLFRSLTRIEHRGMQVKNQLESMKAQKREEYLRDSTTELDWNRVEGDIKQDFDVAFQQDEEVVDKCLLWSSISRELISKKAGTIPAIHQQILNNSNFVDPQIAAQLVMRL